MELTVKELVKKGVRAKTVALLLDMDVEAAKKAVASCRANADLEELKDACCSVVCNITGCEAVKDEVVFEHIKGKLIASGILRKRQSKTEKGDL
jgi:hypothetical protein